MPEGKMTLMEASRMLGASYWKIYRRWQQGKLPAKKMGHYVMVSIDDVLTAIAA